MEDITQYYNRLLGHANKIENNKDNAKDLVQDTYLRAYKLDNFENRSEIYTWLISLMENICGDKIRKKKYSPEVFDLNEYQNQRLISDSDLPLKSERKPSLSEIDNFD